MTAGRRNVMCAVALLTLALIAACSATPRQHAVADEAKDGAVIAKDAVVSGAAAAANGAKVALSKAGDVITDEWISARIHARFVDEKLLKDSDISVETSNRVVTLDGSAMTPAGLARAATVAQETEGVDRVVNRLVVGPKHG